MSANLSTSRFLTIVAASIIIIAGMRAAQALIVPFLLASFLAIILMPIVKWFQRLGFGTAAAVVLIIAVTLCLTFWFSVYVGISVKDFSTQIVELRAQVDKQQMIVMTWIDEHLAFLKPLSSEEETDEDPNGVDEDTESKTNEEGPASSDEKEVESNSDSREPPDEPESSASAEESQSDSNTQTDDEPLTQETDQDQNDIENIESADAGDEQLTAAADTGSFKAMHDPLIEPPEPSKSIRFDTPSRSNGATSSPSAEIEWIDLNATFEFYLKQLLSGVTLIFSNAMLIVITVIFMLFEAARFPAKLVAAFGASHSAMTDIAQVISDVRRYMQIKTLTSALTGVLVIALLIFTDVPLPLLWGLVAFLLNFVPNIGSIIAAVPPVTLAFFEAESGAWTGFWITAAGYVVINFAVSYGIEPKYMGQGLGLSTLVVFLSLVFWGWVLGPVGMLLSAPLTMIVKIVLQNSEETRWMSILLGAKAPDVNPST